MIFVEFFGIPRVRTGVANVGVLEDRQSATLGEVLYCLCSKFPEFGADCVNDGQLAQGYMASINGETFLRSGDARIMAGQSLLILSSDAGG